MWDSVTYIVAGVIVVILFLYVHYVEGGTTV